ncbi:MAG: prolipoprotein diacylglyceryl transferase [Bacillota bacterium]
MRPILFTIAGFPVRSYGFFIAVGIIAGLWLAVAVARRRKRPYAELIWDFALTAMISGILGARVWEVVFTWDYYGQHLVEIPMLWHGGLSIQGAIAGGLLAAIWFTRKHRIPMWDFLDTLTPGVLLGQAIGRLFACFLNGDAYGKPTGSWFGVIYQPDTAAYQVFGAQRLWPAEVFEGLWDLAVMGLALWMLFRRKQPAQGRVVLWYLVLYSLGRFGLEFLRADSLGFFGTGLKAAQVTSLVTAAVAGALLFARRGQGKALTQDRPTEA